MTSPEELDRLRRLREDGTLTEEDYHLILGQLDEAEPDGAVATESAGTEPAGIRYAGFTVRLGALLLDALFTYTCIQLLIQLVLLFAPHNRLITLCFLTPNFLFLALYNIWLVQRFGGTPGKLFLRIGLTRLDGARVGWREAILRELPDLAFFLAIYLGQWWPLWNLTDAGYHALQLLPAADRSHQLAALEPGWLPYVENLCLVWVLNEFIVLFTTTKRRGLQDYLAGTVVVHLPSGNSRFSF